MIYFQVQTVQQAFLLSLEEAVTWMGTFSALGTKARRALLTLIKCSAPEASRRGLLPDPLAPRPHPMTLGTSSDLTKWRRRAP